MKIASDQSICRLHRRAQHLQRDLLLALAFVYGACNSLKPADNRAEVGPPGMGMANPCFSDEDCRLDTVPDDCAVGHCRDQVCAYESVDADGDGERARMCRATDNRTPINTGEDCDDDNPQVNPAAWDGPAGGGQLDGCNDELDQDCDGHIDEGRLEDGSSCKCSAGTLGTCMETSDNVAIDYPALDEDKQPLGRCSFGTRSCLPAGIWSPCSGAIAPSAESCEGQDNDCDGVASADDNDTHKPVFVCDADSDEHLPVQGAVTRESCTTPEQDCAGLWRRDPEPAHFDDCDDTLSTSAPGQPESCDGADNDCDGRIDESSGINFVCDQDSDGHLAIRDATVAVQCDAPANGCAGQWIANPTPAQFDDCDDAEKRSFPSNQELCDSLDNDCNGSVDEGVTARFFCDADDDGHLAPDATPERVCQQPQAPCPGRWLRDPSPTQLDDCDDAEKRAYPGNPEVCDAVDNDCQQGADDGDPGGGASCSTGELGICAAGTWRCTMGALRCAPNRIPQAETCNRTDDDCDGTIDNGTWSAGSPETFSACYRIVSIPAQLPAQGDYVLNSLGGPARGDSEFNGHGPEIATSWTFGLNLLSDQQPKTLYAVIAISAVETQSNWSTFFSLTNSSVVPTAFNGSIRRVVGTERRGVFRRALQTNSVGCGGSYAVRDFPQFNDWQLVYTDTDHARDTGFFVFTTADCAFRANYSCVGDVDGSDFGKTRCNFTPEASQAVWVEIDP